MNKRKLGSFALWAMLFALCLSAEAQQPKKVPRIGLLFAIGSFENQKDSEFVNQLAAVNFFGEPKMEDWYPMIHKINGFYSQPKNDFIPLSVPVFLSIALVKGIPQGRIQSILSKGGGPEVVKDFYESKSVVLVSPGK